MAETFATSAAPAPEAVGAQRQARCRAAQDEAHVVVCTEDLVPFSPALQALAAAGYIASAVPRSAALIRRIWRATQAGRLLMMDGRRDASKAFRDVVAVRAAFPDLPIVLVLEAEVALRAGLAEL